MRILGIDPGTVSLGYGVVDANEGMQMVDFGVLNCSPQAPLAERLHTLYVGLGKIIAQYQPDEVAVEEPYMGNNARAAFAIGAAQAMAILAGANQGLPIYYYSPAQIKLQVTSYGQSDKRQIQEMVKIQLGLSQLPQPSDAADALAVAICHVQQSRFSRWLADRS